VDQEVTTAGSGDVGASVRLCSELFVEDLGLESSTLVDAFLAWARDRMAGRVSVTAARFYGPVGFRPKSVTLEVPL